MKAPAILLPLGFDLNQSYDLQAVMNGAATKEQQLSAIKYIMESLCAYDGEPTNLENVNATYYNLGRRSIARALKDIRLLNLGKVKEAMSKEKK